MATEEFVSRSRKVHGDKYDYSLTNIENKDRKGRVLIICPKHGEFLQNVYSHLKGCGCARCGKESMASSQSLTTETFIEKARKVHGDKYDYSLTEYNGCYEPVTVICPIHGEFKQQASVHLNGHGCQKCAVEANTEKLISSTEDFIRKSRLIHGDKYDYKFVDYKGAKVPVTIVCEKGHVYQQIPNKHLLGHGCPYCTHNISKSETEICGYIRLLGVGVETGDRKTLPNAKELDIVVPSKRLAFEFDGLYWHSEAKSKGKNYHISKTDECEKQGIRLIHIFEDEWLEKGDIVKSRIKNILGLTERKIYARKCTIAELSSKEAKRFLDENHIQGSANSSVRLGLYHDGELVSVMTFCKPRRNLGGKTTSDAYELLRFCNKMDTIVVGGASKLFNFFVETYKPQSIISYADRRWNTGKVYEKLGFEFSHNSQPNYFYIISQRRENRFRYRKDALVRQGFSKDKSEREIMSERGINRIYDCGTKVYKWHFKEK